MIICVPKVPKEPKQTHKMKKKKRTFFRSNIRTAPHKNFICSLLQQEKKREKRFFFENPSFCIIRAKEEKDADVHVLFFFFARYDFL